MIIVDAARVETIGYHSDPEDGELLAIRGWLHVISFRTEYGEEWTHVHPFADDESGFLSAQSVAHKVQAQIAEKGIESLDGQYWSVRTIYGTQAYLDEEPYIVQREKEDALAGY